MAHLAQYVCKSCHKPFSYAEQSFFLKAKRGESRPERCDECRKLYGRARSGVKISYFPRAKKGRESIYVSVEEEYTFHGFRQLAKEIREADWSSMQIGITDEDIEQLYEMLEHNQVVVVVSPTGSGKSTLIPTRLIMPPENYHGDFIERLIHQGQIIVTQPLTAAVERIPETIAKQYLGADIGPGQLFGLRHGSRTGGHKGERYDRWNMGAMVTDGSLRNWIRDGRLNQYSLIMIDEAHQRSCNIETILMLLKNELLRYPNLKVIISSATVNAEKFVQSFEESDISVGMLDLNRSITRKHRYYTHYWQEGTSIDGCGCWLCRDSDTRRSFWSRQKRELKESDLPDTIAEFVATIIGETNGGSILVFLHGEAVIESTARKIRERMGYNFDIPVLPVYSRLGEAEVTKRFAYKGKQRRVLVTTNIAETSHTLDDVVYVIDSGYIKQAEWDPQVQMSRLPSRYHSQAGCRQRWGRVGRVSDGYVYCLYSKEQFEQFDQHFTPEAARSPLDDVILTLNTAGITTPEMLPWLVTRDDFDCDANYQRWNQEQQRAAKAVRDSHFVQNGGLITEKALEIFHVPRSVGMIEALAQGERYNCVFEMMAILFLMMTRDEEPRTGANLYADGAGLFLWNNEWSAVTKTRVRMLHRGLMAGCRDDIAFIAKLLSLFMRFEVMELAREWARYYFVNYQFIKEALEDSESLFEAYYRSKAKEHKRNFDVSLIDSVRMALCCLWNDHIAELNGDGNINFSMAGNQKGVVSPFCAGTWKNNDKALVATITEGEAVYEGRYQQVPIACCMVRLPGQVAPQEVNHLFIDQIFPPGSVVQVEEQNGRSVVSALLDLPPTFKLSYRKTITRMNTERQGEEFVFNERFLAEGMEAHSYAVEGVWMGDERSDAAYVVDIRMENGSPVLMLCPRIDFEEHEGEERDNSRIDIIVHSIEQNPKGKGGWAIGYQSGGLYPLELSELSFSRIGLGLERIVGMHLSLHQIGEDSVGYPIFSNIDTVIADLKTLCEAIEEERINVSRVSRRKFIELDGFIADIQEEEERIVVALPRDKGVVHVFDIAQQYISDAYVQNYRIGDEVTVRFLCAIGKDEIPLVYFTEAELAAIPSAWEIDHDKRRLLVPYCLNDADCARWNARMEIREFVKRHSWQYCLNARVVRSIYSQEVFQKFAKGTRVRGIVKDATKDANNRISGVSVMVSVPMPRGLCHVNGFVPFSELSWLWIQSPTEVVASEERRYCKVVDVNADAVPPRLILSLKQAFMAEATIPRSKIGLLIGRGGSTIKSIVGSSDAKVKIDDVQGIVRVYSSSERTRNEVCSQISSFISEVGNWNND